MRKYLLGTVASVMVIGASGAAMAECNVIDQSYDESIAKNAELRRQIPSSMLRVARELRNAAVTLASYGKDDACETVAEAVRDLLKDPQKAQQVYMDSGNVRRVSEDRPYDEKGWMEYQRERIASAKPVDQFFGRLRADEIIGADVESMTGEDLGEVDDYLIGHDGNRGYVIVSHGGFLGIGDKQVAVPVDHFKLSADRDTFYINMTEEQMEKAPKFDRNKFDWIENDDWRRKNDAYYGGIDLSSDIKPASGGKEATTSSKPSSYKKPPNMKSGAK